MLYLSGFELSSRWVPLISSKSKHHNGHTVCVGPLGSHGFDIVSNFIDLILFHLICRIVGEIFWG